MGFKGAIFDRYLMKNLTVATLATAMALAGIIMLTQSLRFLDLIINSGASGLSFFTLTFLALPRFFEVILPIALMIGTLFIYNKLTADSEMVIMRTSGYSPLRLGRPALMLACLGTIVAFVIASWISPISVAKMQSLRVTLKAQFSSLLLRDGIFNAVGKNMTVYIHEKQGDEFRGILIHDTRDDTKPPVTLLAKRGVMVSQDDKQQVVVFEGTRQQMNPQTHMVERLDFQRYTLDLPDQGAIRQRWREPDERTLTELLRWDDTARNDSKTLKEVRTEIHRRFVSPFLAISFAAISLCFLLLGDSNRRGLALRIAGATTVVVALQGCYLLAYNASKESTAGLVLMYALVFVPMGLSIFCLMPQSDALRRHAVQLWRRYGL